MSLSLYIYLLQYPLLKVSLTAKQFHHPLVLLERERQYKMSCPPARTGRHHQRYEDQFRLVAGCIPYKFEEGVDHNRSNPNKRLRVLMISTPNRQDLVFPKGGWENDEDVKDAARREALEEAGVKGKLSDESLGVWEFRSKSMEKKNLSSNVVGGGCRGHMYAMEVTQQLDSWPEQAIYVRKWLTVEEAFKVCRYDWMRDALRRLLILLSNNEKDEGETREHVQLPKPHSTDHQNKFTLGKFSAVLCLDKTYTRNCPFGVNTYFLGVNTFLFKCGNLFSIFRSISYLERKEGVHKRKPSGS